MKINKELSRIEKIKNWENAISINQIDGEYIPSKKLKELIEKEINGEISANEIIKILVEGYSEKY